MKPQIFAQISFDGVHLLLPQTGVATVEMATNVDAGETGVDGIGKLKSGGREWPVFALTANFDVKAKCPESYKYCVAINDEEEAAFSIACEKVSSIAIANAADIRPLQDCMRTGECPIDGLLFSDNQMMLVGEISILRQYLTPVATT